MNTFFLGIADREGLKPTRHETYPNSTINPHKTARIINQFQVKILLNRQKHPNSDGSTVDSAISC